MGQLSDIFNSKIIGQWPELYDAGNGIMFENSIEIDRISNHLMAVWSPMMDKVFKIRLKGSLKAKVEEDVRCNIGELIKRTRKVYGLASDFVLINGDGKELHRDDNSLRHKKNLWAAKTRANRNPKSGKFVDVKIIIENGEATIYVDDKLFSLWGTEAMNLYLNMLTGLKNRDFLIMINGIIWNDKMTIESKKQQVIRVIPNRFNVIYNVICVVNLEALKAHSINLNWNGQYLNLTAPRNISLGQAFTMWCLMGINIPRLNIYKSMVEGFQNMNITLKCWIIGHGARDLR
jgi:hypothetical protein